ncbi:MAG: hypothetical protein U1D65_17760 [Pseudomonas sp.]|nr:hypothetical protein [Pseudomonas sp.]MDZ4193840.1 hypothetical protein [Pseudomonas sp.]
MSLSATLFGTDSLIFKATNILGLGIPGLLHKTFGPQDPEAQVNSIGDISRQTAKEGDPRTIVWGRVRPIGGNIIHCQSPVKRWVVTSTSTGGKGGGKKKQEQKTEHVYRTYAIGVCEGPITAFSRIWRNNKLVYDARGNDWGARNNGVFLRSFRLYLGGWEQMPDPTLQSIWGAGNVPAYRGTAYMVSIDEDLTDQGGMVPQWQFEVERAEGIYYTSKPYAVEDVDEVAIGSIGGIKQNFEPLDFMVIGQAVVVTGELREPLVTYDDWPPDTIDLSAPTVVSGELRELIVIYDDWPEEELELAQALVASGILRTALIRYENWPEEELSLDAPQITGGSLS